MKVQQLFEAATLAPMVIVNVEDGGGQDYYEGARDALKQLGYHDQGTVLDFMKKLKGVEVKDMQYFENFGVFAPKKPTPEAVRAHLKIKN